MSTRQISDQLLVNCRVDLDKSPASEFHHMITYAHISKHPAHLHRHGTYTCNENLPIS